MSHRWRQIHASWSALLLALSFDSCWQETGFNLKRTSAAGEIYKKNSGVSCGVGEPLKSHAQEASSGAQEGTLRCLHPLPHSTLIHLLSCRWACRPWCGAVHTACPSLLWLLRRREASPGPGQKEQTPMVGPRGPDPVPLLFTGHPYSGAAPAFSRDSVPQGENPCSFG